MSLISVNEVLYIRVALIEGSVYDTVFHTMFPNYVNTIRLANQNAILDALESGEYEDYACFREQKYRIIGGSGLGMPIIYSLVDLMDGNIKLESKESKCTHVVVRIPQKIVSKGMLGKEACRKRVNQPGEEIYKKRLRRFCFKADLFEPP